MSLSKLPSEVLSSVLNNRSMPLRHRLRLRLLSARCCGIIEDGLKKKSSLIIRDHSDDWHPTGKPDHLLIKSGVLSQEHILLFVRLFTGLTRLTLALGQFTDQIDSWSALPALLTQLNTTNLTTLKLYGAFNSGILMRPLVDALTALPSLTSLYLYATGHFTFLLPHLKPILGRLVHLACPAISSDPLLLISTSLSSRCTHLMLNPHLFTTFSDASLTRLSASLTHLHLLGGYNTDWRSLSLLQGLTSLTIQLSYRTTLDSFLIRNLASFPHLTEVKLCNLTFWTRLAFPLENSPALPAIKYLTLQANFSEDFVNFQSFFRALRTWFPSLVRLSLFYHLNLHPAIQANFRETPFTVELYDYYVWHPMSSKW